MQILSIQLKNIKSHREAELSFSSGINVLSGPNGVGKSTVFEAIGYALFGVDARDFVSNIDRFLTIGAKRGEIAVTFIAADGETYRVTRTVGTPSTWRLAKHSGDLFETEDHAGAGETEERIRELLGLAKGRSLADQFKLVIGPFQSDFLGPFVLKQPMKRREAFDEILGIDSWRKTFDGTKELGSIIKGKIGSLETEIAGKGERIEALPERRAELETILRDEVEKGRELHAVAAELTTITALLGTLEEKRTSIERLRGEILQADASILSGKEHIGSQMILVTEAEAAVRTIEETKEGKARYDAAERTLVELREREKTRQCLEKEVSDLESQVASVLQSAGHEEGEAAAQEKSIISGRAEVVNEEKELQERLAKLGDDERTLHADRDRLRQVDGHFRNLAIGKIDTLLPYVQVTLNRIVEVDARIHDRKRVLLDEGAWRERAASLDELRKKREEMLASRSLLLGKLTGLSEGEEKLQEGLCPFLGERCRNLNEAGSLAVFPERKLELERDIAEAGEGVAVLDKEIAGAEAAAAEIEMFRAIRVEIESLEKEQALLAAERENNLVQLDPAGMAAEFDRWAREHRLDDCRSEGERLLGGSFSGSAAEQLVELEEWEGKCHHVATFVESILTKLTAGVDAPLTALQADRARVEARLVELARRRQEIAEAERSVVERRNTAALHRERAGKVEGEALAKKELVAAFSGVDVAIRETEEERRRSQSDHERFLQAEPVASDIGRRTEILERYRKRLEQLEQEQMAKTGALADLSASYSPEDHTERQRQKEVLHSREAALNENLRNLEQNRQRLANEIDELQKIEEEMKKKQEEVRELRRKEELVKFLRMKVFKNVSAQLSERFREEITLRADRIYRTIAESDEELVWGEDYRIILRDMAGGDIRERTDDQLSGGQTMSAVVALRLALLQTIGARLAFFDEPTSNLDAARRENLAQAFRAIDHGKEEVTEHWYDQLFLISHDVAFTEVTDQVIPLGE